jgi:DNA or RNA helicases of superfamily II
MKLRENQIEPVAIGVEFFRTPKMKPSIIVAPTAFGKSIVIAAIAKELGEKILVLQPSKELLEQNYNKFITLGGEASIYSASMGSKELGDVTYATIGSIINIAYKFKEMGVTKIIIDECDRYPRNKSGQLRKVCRWYESNSCTWSYCNPLKITNQHGRYWPIFKVGDVNKSF